MSRRKGKKILVSRMPKATMPGGVRVGPTKPMEISKLPGGLIPGGLKALETALAMTDATRKSGKKAVVVRGRGGQLFQIEQQRRRPGS